MFDRVFHAIAHPERRAILKLIKAAGELHASQIAESFHFTKPTLSHHLKALTDAELLVRERRGQFIYFQINQSVFEEVLGAMCELFGVGLQADDSPGARPSRPEPTSIPQEES